MAATQMDLTTAKGYAAYLLMLAEMADAKAADGDRQNRPCKVAHWSALAAKHRATAADPVACAKLAVEMVARADQQRRRAG
jgi:hypothetical protein